MPVTEVNNMKIIYKLNTDTIMSSCLFIFQVKSVKQTNTSPKNMIKSKENWIMSIV